MTSCDLTPDEIADQIEAEVRRVCNENRVTEIDGKPLAAISDADLDQLRTESMDAGEIWRWAAVADEQDRRCMQEVQR